MSSDNFYPFDGHDEPIKNGASTSWLIAFVLLFDIAVMSIIGAAWLWEPK